LVLSPEYPTRAGKLRFLGFESTVLAGNRYGDPTYRQHPVYLPPSYESSRERRYPIVYGLTGYTGTGLHLFGPGTFTEPLHDRLDRLIDEGMPEILFVGIDCMTRLGGSQYVNGAAGRYEDYVVHEVLPAAEAELRTTAPEGGRGLMGKSSGGFGTLFLGMRHPGLFHALACHSGDAGFDLSIVPDVATLVRQLDRFEGDEAAKIEAFLDDFDRTPKKSPAQGHALMTLACAAAYSPDEASPVGFVLPFDPHTGRIRPKIWERWLAFDPVRMIEHHADALRKARLLFLDCGSRDQYALQLGARQLHERLTALDVPHVYEEFEDDHSGVQYRYDVSLPRLASTLQSDPSAAGARP
jgi:enterochelin esterase-like enzyme